MCGAIVHGYVIIQCSVNSAGSQTHRNGEKADPQIIFGKSNAKQSRCGHAGADNRDATGAQFLNDSGAEQAGCNGPQAIYGSGKVGVGYGQIEFRINCRPGGSEQRVRESQTNKTYVNNN